MIDAWKRYQGDFNAMTDGEVDEVTEECRRQVEEAEDWLEAVASWKAAGKPRMENSNGQ
ncbi:hypothetical protein [Novosphingobium sp. M1R2S20]|uniref:Rop-like protein n=1 Tax=Novosphingobium rhizovicinum TaxID=3228928 RepID=A0ABV3RD10_9SPHN